MFRRLQESLPADFTFPADLKGLGYFVNDQDQIRQIENPKQRFHYFISKNDRYVEMQKEAMNQCIRKIVFDRLDTSGLETTRLPVGTPANFPHVPVLTSKNLNTCKRCIVYVGESCQELGTLAGRLIDQESIGTGSVINFVNAIRRSDPENEVGIIIANPGQLVWHRRGGKALSFDSWNALPRPTAVSPTLPMTAKNQIPQNYDSSEHVACVFEDVVAPLQQRGCKLAVIAADGSGIDVIKFVQKDWRKWKRHLEAIVVTSGYIWHTEITEENFGGFWGQRGRAYLVSNEPLGTPLTGRPQFGCNVYSSGEPTFVECIVPRAYEAILDYFRLLERIPDYVNVPPDEEETAPSTVKLEDPSWSDDEEERVPKETRRVGELGIEDYALTQAMGAVNIDPGDGKNGDKDRGSDKAGST